MLSDRISFCTPVLSAFINEYYNLRDGAIWDEYIIQHKVEPRGYYFSITDLRAYFIVEDRHPNIPNCLDNVDLRMDIRLHNEGFRKNNIHQELKSSHPKLTISSNIKNYLTNYNHKNKKSINCKCKYGDIHCWGYDLDNHNGKIGIIRYNVTDNTRPRKIPYNELNSLFKVTGFFTYNIVSIPIKNYIRSLVPCVSRLYRIGFHINNIEIDDSFNVSLTGFPERIFNDKIRYFHLGNSRIFNLNLKCLFFSLDRIEGLPIFVSNREYWKSIIYKIRPEGIDFKSILILQNINTINESNIYLFLEFIDNDERDIEFRSNIVVSFKGKTFKDELAVFRLSDNGNTFREFIN
jgi:hypothetical protein